MERVFKQIEEDFDTVMSSFGIHGDCHIKYEESHPEGANYSGVVTCSGNMMCKNFVWTMQYWPASQTANGFVNMVKAKLFDMLVDVANQAGFDDETS